MTSSIEPVPTTPHTDQRVPDFFIVGHHKCGTTALWRMLRSHPQIYMPDLKEPRFFADDLKAKSKRGYPDTLEEYLSLFEAAKPEQRAGEASPSYLRSQTAARAIAQVQPDARIIAILREPASFIRSFHLDLLQRGLGENEQDLRRAMEREKFVRLPAWGVERRYSDHVRYVEQLRRYHAVFPRDQVLVLIYDDFRADNQAVIRTVLRFLDVDDTYPVEVQEANQTFRARYVRLNHLIRALRRGTSPPSRALKATIKGITTKGFRESFLYPLRRRIMFAEPRPPDEEFMLELRRRFKPEVVAISEYLGRDLVRLWGYDHIE
jgi:Sulfotransferase domain